MKWLPEARRSQGAIETVATLLGLAYVASFLATLLSGDKAPQMYEPLIGVLPMLMLGVAVACLVLLLAAKERLRNAVAFALALAWISSALSLVATSIGLWNDGSYYNILTPATAFLSILTFGLFPFHFGPDALIRFLPAVFAIGLFLRCLRARVPFPRLALGVGGGYLLLGAALHALSWVAGLLSLANSTSLAQPTDVYRVLVSAQSNGYWTLGQAERFLSPLGRQADTALILAHAAVVFLVMVICAAAVARLTMSIRSLVKRLASRPVVLFGMEFFLGASLAVGTQVARATYTEMLAYAIFFIVVFLWCSWWRIVRDLENIARDELEHPDYPLPSGTVTPHDLEALSHVLLSISLFGAWVLGWPVFFGLLSASLLAWADSRGGFGLRDGVLTHAVVITGIGLGIAWSGAALAIQEAAMPAWLIRILLSAALLFGLSALSKGLRTMTDARPLLAGLLTLGMGIALLIANQQVFWLYFLPAAAGMFLLAFRPGKWHRYGSLPIDGFLGFMLFIALFLPKTITHL